MSDSPTPRFMDRDLATLVARLSFMLDSWVELDVLRGHDVTLTQFRVLAALRDAGERGQFVTRLAALCAMQQPTMTKHVDVMVARGLAAREREDSDRRMVRVVLTSAGQSLADELVRQAELHNQGLSRRVPWLASALLDALHVLHALQAGDGASDG